MSFWNKKTWSSKSRKIDIFSKGLTHGFVPKNGYFSNFLLGNIGQENVFYDILEQRNAFLGYKNMKFKKSKNWHFIKGVLVFGPKMAIFSDFFLGNIGQENVFYNILEQKNVFLSFKSKKFKKSKTFFQRG